MKHFDKFYDPLTLNQTTPQGQNVFSSSFVYGEIPETAELCVKLGC